MNKGLALRPEKEMHVMPIFKKKKSEAEAEAEIG